MNPNSNLPFPLAIVAITKGGVALGLKIAQKISREVTLYLPPKFLPGEEIPRNVKPVPFKENIGNTIRSCWSQYRAFIFIMATGIVVRLIAPLIKSKTLDPAVVVVDQRGENVISLLSGHLGGANRLTRELAKLLKAHPVITTATDKLGLISWEELALELDFALENTSALTKANAALVNQEPIPLFSDLPPEILFPPGFTLPLNVLWSGPIREIPPKEVAVAITSRRVPMGENILFLRPKNLALGLGCRRGVDKREVILAINQALELSGQSRLSLRLLASVDIKRDERGLLEAAEELGLPVVFFPKDKINNFLQENGHLNFSQKTFQRIGVGGVCEPAALMGIPSPRLILPKTNVGRVTVALAEAFWPLWELAREIQNT